MATEMLTRPSNDVYFVDFNATIALNAGVCYGVTFLMDYKKKTVSSYFHAGGGLSYGAPTSGQVTWGSLGGKEMVDEKDYTGLFLEASISVIYSQTYGGSLSPNSEFAEIVQYGYGFESNAGLSAMLSYYWHLKTIQME